MKKKSKEKVLSDFMYGLTKKLSKEKGIEIDELYTSEWGEYFSNYVNSFMPRKFLIKKYSAKETLKVLNENYVKDVQGTYIPLLFCFLAVER